MAKSIELPQLEHDENIHGEGVYHSGAFRPKKVSRATDGSREVTGTSLDIAKEDISFGRVDREVAEYMGAAGALIDEETDKRLKRMIDRRVLVIMIITYFLQALDKGTMSFASIMDLIKDTHLKDQEVSTHRSLPAFVDFP